MICLALIVIAAICNAVMDITSHKYAWSIFHKYDFNAQYWDPRVSWRNKYVDGDKNKGRKKFMGITIHVAFTDGWHLCKSIMIVCLCAAICFGYSLPKICVYNAEILNLICWIVVLGTVWNITFSLFYDKILRE